jgi:hypothetical protein
VYRRGEGLGLGECSCVCRRCRGFVPASFLLEELYSYAYVSG